MTHRDPTQHLPLTSTYLSLTIYQLEKLEAVRSAYLWLPLIIFPYHPYLFFPYLSLPFLTLPYLLFPYLSLPFPSFPYLSLPFLTFPYLSLPFLTFPYLSLPFLTFPDPYWPLMSLTGSYFEFVHKLTDWLLPLWLIGLLLQPKSGKFPLKVVRKWSEFWKNQSEFFCRDLASGNDSFGWRFWCNLGGNPPKNRILPFSSHFLPYIGP